MSPKQDGPTNRVMRSFDWLGGSRSSATRLTESRLLGPWGLSIYTFMGAGPSLVVDCACVSHELLKHVEWHSVLPTVSTDLVYFQGSPLTLPAVGGKQDRKTSLTQVSMTSSPRLDRMPSYGLFVNKNITLRKHVVNTVKYNHKKYKIQGTMA